jgi:hypothetical protein
MTDWRDYRDMSDDALDDMLKRFPSHSDYPAMVFEHQRRQKLKDQEADEKRDTVSQSRYGETIGLAQKTLFWAKVAGTVAITALLIAVVGLLVQTQVSKPQHATPESALPNSLRQTITPTSESQVPVATPNIDKPSIEPSVTVSPSPSTK